MELKCWEWLLSKIGESKHGEYLEESWVELGRVLSSMTPNFKYIDVYI